MVRECRLQVIAQRRDIEARIGVINVSARLHRIRAEPEFDDELLGKDADAVKGDREELMLQR